MTHVVFSKFKFALRDEAETSVSKDFSTMESPVRTPAYSVQAESQENIAPVRKPRAIRNLKRQNCFFHPMRSALSRTFASSSNVNMKAALLR